MWANIVKLLLSQGHSQKSLAEKVGVNQSTVCRLADGDGPEPRWSVGAALIEMAGGPDVLSQNGIDVAWFLRSAPPPAAPAAPAGADSSGYTGPERRDPNRPSRDAGADWDRRSKPTGIDATLAGAPAGEA